MHELEFIDSQTSSPKNLRAALSLNDKLVAVQSNLNEKRSRFSVLHEVAHFVLPEHRNKLFLDDDETLSWWTKARLEKEANQVAAELLFQGRRFSNEAIECPLSISTILDLAPRFGASYEAAARRLVDQHILPCALLVYDKISKTNEVDFEEDFYSLQYVRTSDPFKKQFFRGVESKPNRFSASELYRPKRWGEVTESELVVTNDERSKWHFGTDVFSNGYKIFQLVKHVQQAK